MVGLYFYLDFIGTTVSQKQEEIARNNKDNEAGTYFGSREH
jgi:hypothetical protein